MELNTKNTVIIVIAMLIIAVAAVGVYYFFIYDDATEYTFTDVSFKAHDKGIVLNSTESDSSAGFSYYNANRTTVKVFKLNQADWASKAGFNMAFDTIKNYPTKTYNDRVMYCGTANQGEFVGEVRYTAFIEDNDKNVVVTVTSSTLEETDYIASTVKILV